MKPMKHTCTAIVLTVAAFSARAEIMLYAMDNTQGGQVQLWDSPCPLRIADLKDGRLLRVTREGRAPLKGCWKRDGDKVRAYYQTMSGWEVIEHEAKEFVKQ